MSPPTKAPERSPAQQGQQAEAAGPVQRSTDDRLADLESRVARLENRTGNRLVRQTQEEADEEILSRTPNSYAEAVRYEAALKRREGKSGTDKTDDSGR